MKILIHACPQRMWYVENHLVPALRAQGAENIEIWNDAEGKGNLRACMESFAARSGSGGTWHIQDDVLPARDFVKRCRENDEGVVYGFCNERFHDDPGQAGRVSVEDAWHSFQCVRIPDEYARGCAEWLHTKGKENEYYSLWVASGRMDDNVFTAYMISEHGREMITNLKPNIVEHVDWIIGGSTLTPWREFLPRAYFWDDEELVQELKEAVKGEVQYTT